MNYHPEDYSFDPQDIPINTPDRSLYYSRVQSELTTLENETITFFSKRGTGLGSFLETPLINVAARQSQGKDTAQMPHELIVLAGRPYSGKTFAAHAIERMTTALEILPENVESINWEHKETQVRLAHGLPTDSLDRLPDELLPEVNQELAEGILSAATEKLLTVVQLPFSSAVNVSESEEDEQWIGRILGETALESVLNDTNRRKVPVRFVGLAPGPALSYFDTEKREEGAPPEMVEYIFNLMIATASDLSARGLISLPAHIQKSLPGEIIHMEETDTYFQQNLSSSIREVANYISSKAKRRKMLAEHIAATDRFATRSAQSLASLYIMNYLGQKLKIPQQNMHLCLMNPPLRKMLEHSKSM